MGLYQELHSHLHHPVRPLRFFYCCSNKENLLAWVSITKIALHQIHHKMFVSKGCFFFFNNISSLVADLHPSHRLSAKGSGRCNGCRDTRTSRFIRTLSFHSSH